MVALASLVSLLSLSLPSACIDAAKPTTDSDAALEDLAQPDMTAPGDSQSPDSDATPDAPEDGLVDVTDVTTDAPDVFVCSADPDCVPIIGAVGVCETAACNTLTGRCFRTIKPDGTPCADRDRCTTDERCRSGLCEARGALDCDDKNPCTRDRCDASAGCLHEPFDERCDDGNACTVRDRCTEGRCRGDALVCDDGDPCTLDSCDRSRGCVYEPLDPCPARSG